MPAPTFSNDLILWLQTVQDTVYIPANDLAIPTTYASIFWLLKYTSITNPIRNHDGDGIRDVTIPASVPGDPGLIDIRRYLHDAGDSADHQAAEDFTEAP